MTDLPTKALSIRQPWAWAIIHAGKDVENRDWSTRYRGSICIHASKGMTKREFSDFVDLGRELVRAGKWVDDLWIPEPDDLQRGGIVGLADIVDCADRNASPWFFGKYGFVLQNARPVEFIPVRGALGIFNWERNIDHD